MALRTEPAKAAISQTGRSGTVKTDETAVSRLLAVSAVPTEAVPAMREQLSSVLAVTSPAVLEKYDSSIAVTEDPDRWCWPHSSAMNGAEIDTFTKRRSLFTGKGISQGEAEAVADTLVLRDRDLDDRRLCLECSNLQSHWAGAWRCGDWQWAGIAHPVKDAQLSAQQVLQPQRCSGFKAAQGADYGRT